MKNIINELNGDMYKRKHEQRGGKSRKREAFLTYCTIHNDSDIE